MRTYLFDTDATMKENDRQHWWIDSKIIPQMKIYAESVNEALEKYRQRVAEVSTMTISNNALKTKQPMYRDGKNREAVQVGWVLTAKDAYFRDDERGRWVEKYADLWVEITELVSADFCAA